MRPRLRKRKTTEKTSRGAGARDAASASSYRYSSRRKGETFNVGRNENKTSKKPKNKAGMGTKAAILLAIVIALVLVYKIIHISDTPKIVAVYPSNQPTLAITGTSEYQQSAQKLFGSFWNSNKVTVNAVNIENKLKSEYPGLESITVSIPFFQSTPNVYIEPALPSFIVKTNSSQYFLLDINGRAIAEASSTQKLPSNSVNNTVVNDQSGLTFKSGQQVLPSSDITFMEVVLAQLKAKSIVVSSFTLPPVSQELDVYMAGRPYFAKFNLAEYDPRQQAGTLIATINQLKSQNITPAKYIDVRVDGRAYYM
ncbi:MAG TPA: hypothetical protein VL989_04045 [Candidatus Sulfotelmatobacter sp.]|nr:hypothetical protein [Candidatus Sulfotelmatobacter sp.]